MNLHVMNNLDGKKGFQFYMCSKDTIWQINLVNYFLSLFLFLFYFVLSIFLHAFNDFMSVYFLFFWSFSHFVCVCFLYRSLSFLSLSSHHWNGGWVHCNGFEHMLCILTSSQVLLARKAGRITFFEPLSTFILHFKHKKDVF